jgi:ElaB/YqjD/DUF883 family membrane-anchored ribosome-binding protein
MIRQPISPPTPGVLQTKLKEMNQELKKAQDLIDQAKQNASEDAQKQISQLQEKMHGLLLQAAHRVQSAEANLDAKDDEMKKQTSDFVDKMGELKTEVMLKLKTFK